MFQTVPSWSRDISKEMKLWMNDLPRLPETLYHESSTCASHYCFSASLRKPVTRCNVTAAR